MVNYYRILDRLARQGRLKLADDPQFSGRRRRGRGDFPIKLRVTLIHKQEYHIYDILCPDATLVRSRQIDVCIKMTRALLREIRPKGLIMTSTVEQILDENVKQQKWVNGAYSTEPIKRLPV